MDKNIHEMIPADDLHWCEEDGKYTALSTEELNKIIEGCLKGTVESEECVPKIVDWASQLRSSHLLLKGVIEGRLAFVMLEDSEEPSFVTAEKTEQVQEFFGDCGT